MVGCTHVHLAPRLRISGSIPLLHPRLHGVDKENFNIIGLNYILRQYHHLRLQVCGVYDMIIVKIELVIIGNYCGISADMSYRQTKYIGKYQAGYFTFCYGHHVMILGK